ncbi:efflux RND transporter periplasmic adaptor subunit [Aggregicoccus sp. 17bor-14]|uniref:efflux RND transporter periplasmic adaptor subunit n=1 Tax=Myxococcaceae TaxID=31 RepID=UPI00129C6400|nr:MULTISPECIES: efflux RND transporter periplasmic adaptor subunit [Myxococcaceae]MBF5046471.1 efflux RND transporter periplasmic adaptor subunit [Simulacricoccus sp. 17bor-14]MRI92188.1 efflux RND transporter periplasmic adaptor subunit [Aggregicoccus sp. 17bor-14]
MTPHSRRLLLRGLGLLSLLLLIALFWRPLVAWFRGSPAPRMAVHAPAPTAQAQAALPPAALDAVRTAFAAAEGVRTLLARDSVEGLAPRAEATVQALRTATGALPAGSAPSLAAELNAGTEAASRLAHATALPEARTHFAALSQRLEALARMDPRLQQGWVIYSCPMTKGPARWVQRPGALANPYMGEKMLACGTAVAWSEPAAPHAHAGEVAYYTCPMHPAVRQAQGGQCPICGMDLTAVTRADVDEGVIRVDEARRERIGVRTAVVALAPLHRAVRAFGRVTYDETAVQDVTLRLDGYIEGLHASATGQQVKRGDVLFRLYSPELYAAQAEYLLARQGQSAANASLVAASRQRLKLWGLTDAQVAQLAERGRPAERVPFFAPASGYVLEKNVAEGAAVKAGERLFRIVPLERVWVEAEVYEQDLSQVRAGQAVEVTLPALPGKQLRGTVGAVLPTLDPSTRTGRVRVVLANEGLALKPSMFADVRFEVASGERLQVPEEAVLYTGPRTLVFVDLGDGRLAPREVRLGLQGEGTWEVLSGVKAGERVVTQGNFLLAAESRIRSGAEYWGEGADDAR